MLVIFDCDGVLVDSERLASEVFSDEIKRIGGSMSADECLAVFKGKTLGWCFEYLRTTCDLSITSAFEKELDVATERAFTHSLKAIAGIENIIQHVDKLGAKRCVASNGGREKVIASLKTTRLYNYFGDDIFSAQQVSKGKPDPELFLYACDKMGQMPAKAIVIEDSFTGVAAACAAKIPVIHLVIDEAERAEAEANAIKASRISGQSVTVVHSTDKIAALLERHAHNLADLS